MTIKNRNHCQFLRIFHQLLDHPSFYRDDILVTVYSMLFQFVAELHPYSLQGFRKDSLFLWRKNEISEQKRIQLQESSRQLIKQNRNYKRED